MFNYAVFRKGVIHSVNIPQSCELSTLDLPFVVCLSELRAVSFKLPVPCHVLADEHLTTTQQYECDGNDVFVMELSLEASRQLMVDSAIQLYLK